MRSKAACGRAWISEKKPDPSRHTERNAGAVLSPCTDAASVWQLTITEGKFHQVKRKDCRRWGEMVYLKRLRMGTLLLDENAGPGRFQASWTAKELSGPAVRKGET